MPLTVENGTLTGPGADLIRDAVSGATYVMVGEDHGIAQVPEFSSALFKELAPAGFKTLVLEVGPSSAAELQRMLDAAAPSTEINSYQKGYPFSLAFYNWKEEFDFLASARQAAGTQLRVVGIDQELMGTSRLILTSIQRKHRSDDVGIEVERLLKDEQNAYAEAAKTGRPDLLFMMTAKADDLQSLKDKLTKSHDVEGAEQVQRLLDSREIYSQMGKSAYESNLTRAMLMKRYFKKQADQLPHESQKMMFKFGANHVMKGLNLVDSREIGNYVAETADGRSEKSVHILIVATGGEQLRFAGVGRRFQAATVDANGPGQSDMPFAKASFRTALGDSGSWAAFDLRALRSFANGTANIDERWKRIIFGFDIAVVIPKATPSTEIY